MINGRCEEGQPDGVDGSVRSLNNLEFHIEKKDSFSYSSTPLDRLVENLHRKIAAG